MQQCDFDKFVDVLQVTAEQYNKKLSDGLLALYWQGLHDVDLIAFKDALGRHLRNPDSGQFMPKIADIMKMLNGSSLDAALSAWSKVEKAIRAIGPWRSVAFDDPIIHRVIDDMGGWDVLCNIKTDEDLPFVARDFENRYRGFKSRSQEIEYPPRLSGISDAENILRGFITASSDLVAVGQESKVREVLQNGSMKKTVQFTRIRNITLAIPEATK